MKEVTTEAGGDIEGEEKEEEDAGGLLYLISFPLLEKDCLSMLDSGDESLCLLYWFVVLLCLEVKALTC